MLSQKERKELIASAMKSTIYTENYLNTFSDDDLIKMASWGAIWGDIINDKTSWEHNRIKEINKYVQHNHKPAVMKSGDIYLVNNDVLELYENNSKDSEPCVIFTDVFRDWLEENNINL